MEFHKGSGSGTGTELFDFLFVGISAYGSVRIFWVRRHVRIAVKGEGRIVSYLL